MKDLDQFAPDLTHTHGIWLYPSVATNSYCRRKAIPYLISAHGMLDPWAIRNARWKKAIAYFLYEGAHLRGARCLRAFGAKNRTSKAQIAPTNSLHFFPQIVLIRDTSTLAC